LFWLPRAACALTAPTNVVPPVCPGVGLSAVWAWPFASALVAVGHDPHPIPFVRRADRPSTHHARPAGVTFLFQVREYPVAASASQSRNILSQHPLRSNFSNDPPHLKPQSALLAVYSRTFPRTANVSAWESAANNVNGQQSVSIKFR